MKQTTGAALAAALVIAGCGDGNQQSISVGSGTTGNISQSQSGVGNAQSISIGSTDGKANITQSQTGVNKSQSITIDGKKVETKSN